MFLVSPCSCLRSIHWSQVLSWEWRCSWSSADRRCSNYIWVINNFIAYWSVTYIRGFTVFDNSVVTKINYMNISFDFDRDACQISEWLENSKHWSRTFKTYDQTSYLILKWILFNHVVIKTFTCIHFFVFRVSKSGMHTSSHRCRYLTR